MNKDTCRELFLELLRIALIAVRNLALTTDRVTEHNKMLSEWAIFCHSLPTILIGDCDARAIRYFLAGDAALFIRNYPRKEDADYIQIRELVKELTECLDM
jgi:hypothetical protein